MVIKILFSLKCQDICFNIPGVINMIHNEWKNDELSSKEVTVILNNIRKQSSYAICAINFLCACTITNADVSYYGI